ncbi:MAG: hypothetical protein WBB07_20750 [Mycobacterium sp.]
MSLKVNRPATEIIFGRARVDAEQRRELFCFLFGDEAVAGSNSAGETVEQQDPSPPSTEVKPAIRGSRSPDTASPCYSKKTNDSVRGLHRLAYHRASRAFPRQP